MTSPTPSPSSKTGAASDQVFANLSDPGHAAALYWEHGFVAIPTDAKTHKPLIKGWSDDGHEATELLCKFGAGTNIALVCGPTSGALADIDLDEDLAVKLAPEFLPGTQFVFGRDGRPASHYTYRIEGESAHMSFKAPDGFGLRPFVEVLARKHLITVPPSIHPKDGQLVRFEPGKAGLPKIVKAEHLYRGATLLAVSCLVATFWPKTAGSRHDLALAVAGALLRSDLSADEVRKIVLVASREAGDPEYEDRAAAVDDTAKKKAKGQAFTGWPHLAEELGTVGLQLVKTLQKWLGRSEKDLATLSLSDVVISGKALAAKPVSERPNIVAPWLKSGGVVLTYSQAKVGKTWFCLELAICVAMGRDFLDYEVTDKRTVLYIDAEMSLGEKKERLNKLAGATERLFILDAYTFAQKFDRTLDLTREDCQGAVSQFVEEHDVELVVIDTLASLAPRQDENDNASPELQSLMRLAQAFKARDVSVVFVHHAGHEGKHPRGASALIAFVDTVLALRKRDDDGLVELEFTHTRDKRPDPSKIAFRISDAGEVVTLDVVHMTKSSPEYELLPVLLQGEYTTQKALGKVVDKSTGTISVWVNKLRGQGLVDKGKLKLTAKGKDLVNHKS